MAAKRKSVQKKKLVLKKRGKRIVDTGSEDVRPKKRQTKKQAAEEIKRLNAEGEAPKVRAPENTVTSNAEPLDAVVPAKTHTGKSAGGHPGTEPTGPVDHAPREEPVSKRVIEQEIIVSIVQLMNLLNLSPHRFKELLSVQVFDSYGHGTYEVFRSVNLYITYLSKQRSESPSKVKDFESARLTRIRANKEQLLYEELDKSLMRVGDVELAWSRILVSLRQALLSMPGQIDHALQDAKPKERAEVVDEAIRKTLEILSSEPNYQQKITEDSDEAELLEDRRQQASG